MIIHLIRHGQTDWNLEGKLQGTQDIPLNTRGHSEAKKLGMRLKAWPVNKVIVSPLLRARQTADASFNDYTIIEGFREIELGEWEGMTKATLWHHRPDLADNAPFDTVETAAKNGESWRDLLARASETFKQVIDTSAPTDTIVIVTHGGVIKTLVADLLAMPLKRRAQLSIDNTSITTLEIGDGEALIKLLRYNDTAHLEWDE